MEIKLTVEEQKELQGILPLGYAKTISDRLNTSGLKPARAKSYNPKIIRDVLARRQSDFNVLLELFRYKDEILTKEQELKKLRKKQYESKAEDQSAKRNQ